MRKYKFHRQTLVQDGLRAFLFALTLIGCSVVIFGQTEDSRVSATWKVQKYDIVATLPQSEADRSLLVKAKVEAANVSSRPASTMTLRISPNANVSGVSVNGTSTDFSKREEKLGSGSLQQIVVRMPSVAVNGTTNVEVSYKFEIKDNSGLAALSPFGSQFLPLSFWYPTPNSWFFARGADHAPVRIQVSAPAGLIVVSSGTEAGSVHDSKVSGQPFFVAGSWDVATASGISIYTPKGADTERVDRAKDVGTIASDAKVFLEPILGPAPTVPLRVVAVRRGSGFNDSGTILFDEAVLRRPKVDSQTALSIAEGVARMWLGSSIVINGDGGGAVREGLARYLATQFLENKYGKDVADVERLRQRVAYSAVVQRDAPINTVSPLDDYYYTVVANKGAMIWRLLAQKAGASEFSSKLKAALEDKIVTLAEIRTLFPDQKAFLDYGFDQTTDMNLMAGLPLQGAGEAKVNLRNTGSVDVTVDVEALLDNGQRMSAPTTIRATSFGEVSFRTSAKVVRVEIDRQKLYPQTDFSDDVAPREMTDSDPLLAVKRSYDRQEYAAAEKTARQVLNDFPRLDDVRVLLARSLLALNRNADAQREFQAVLDEKLPTARSISWAYVGLAEVAARANQSDQAAKFAGDAIKAEGEYGAALAARNIRTRLGARSVSDPSIATFFEQWDRAAAANQKAQLDALVLPGEASRFSGGVAGQTAAWKTDIKHVDLIDPNTALVETHLSIKLLNKDPETGMAVFRLARSGNSWKISSVDIFEVR
jgi:tetratricopeptide (TPR) repeat protein